MMLEMVQDRTATGVTRGFERLLYCDVESKLKNCHIITLPGQSLSKNRNKFELLPLEAEQSGGKLPPIRISGGGGGGGVFLNEKHSVRFPARQISRHSQMRDMAFFSACRPSAEIFSTVEETVSQCMQSLSAFKPLNKGKQIYQKPVSHFKVLCTKRLKLGNTHTKGKGKVFPLHTSTGPWGSGRLRLPDFS
jgi:hypothetical protein